MNTRTENWQAAGKRLIRGSLVAAAASLLLSSYVESLAGKEKLDVQQGRRSLKVMLHVMAPSAASVQLRDERRSLPGGSPTDLRKALRNATSDA